MFGYPDETLFRVYDIASQTNQYYKRKSSRKVGLIYASCLSGYPNNGTVLIYLLFLYELLSLRWTEKKLFVIVRSQIFV